MDQKIADQLIKCFQSGNKCLIFGNGGSLADAAHFAAEFNGIGSIIALNDPVKITSIANDYGFEYIFSKQVEDLGNKDDLIIGLSSSGQSQNVINALWAAHSKGLYQFEFPRKGKTTQEVQEYQHHLLHQIYLKVKEHYDHHR